MMSQDMMEDTPTDMSDHNPLKTMMDTMAKHGANVELKKRMPDGSYQTASEGTMKALGAQARMSSTAQVLNSMTKEERDLWAIEMRQIANELYKEKKYEEALGRYMEAITASDLGTSSDSQCNVDTVIVPLLCNMSACCVQLKDWGKALRFCDQCLLLRPKCVKALTRRGLARVQLGEYLKGESDLLESLDIVPEDDVIERERIRGILLKAKRGLHEQTLALEKRKVSMQKAFASKEGGIGDERAKEKPITRRNKRKPESTAMFLPIRNIIVLSIIFFIGFSVVYVTVTSFFS